MGPGKVLNITITVRSDVSLCSVFLPEHNKDWPACDIVHDNQSLPVTHFVITLAL